MYRTILIAAAAFSFPASVPDADAQGLFTQRASFYSWMRGSKETMRGSITMGVISRRGKLSGRTSTGIRCWGRTRLNASLSRGSGSMRCKDGRSGKFSYTLSSRFPPRGKGRGRLKSGKKVFFRISP